MELRLHADRQWWSQTETSKGPKLIIVQTGFPINIESICLLGQGHEIEVQS